MNRDRRNCESKGLKVQIVEMQSARNRSRRGLVKIRVMKNLNVLKAHSNLQAQSKNLRLNAQIGLSEQGKVSHEK